MLSDLAWLPPPPANFRESVKALRAEATAPAKDFYERAVALATASLDENQLGQLARLVRETFGRRCAAGGLLARQAGADRRRHPVAVGAGDLGNPACATASCWRWWKAPTAAPCNRR